MKYNFHAISATFRNPLRECTSPYVTYIKVHIVIETIPSFKNTIINLECEFERKLNEMKFKLA